MREVLVSQKPNERNCFLCLGNDSNSSVLGYMPSIYLATLYSVYPNFPHCANIRSVMYML